jgi:hypothetical protein
MAQNNTKNWEAARTQLVEQRQTTIDTLAKGDSLAKGYAKERSENHIDLLIKIQAGIDALDKAKDEIFRSVPIQDRSKKRVRYASDDDNNGNYGN